MKNNLPHSRFNKIVKQRATGILSSFFFLIALFLMNTTAKAQPGNVPELIYYQFNSGTTSVPNMASSPVGNNPAPLTNLTIGSGGFNGSNGLIGTGATSAAVSTGWNTRMNGDFTFAFWTSNVPSSSTLYYIFGDAGASSFRCFTNGVAGANNWMVRGAFPDITFTGAATMVSNMMHVVYDATALTVTGYLNGVQVTQVSVTSPLNVTGTGLTVGGYGSSASLNGILDEFRWYNRALSAQEIASTYSMELPLSTAANDAAVASIDSPIVFCAGPNDVYATIRNAGTNQIDSVEVHWEVNGVVQPAHRYRTLLDTFNGAFANSASVFLGTANFNAGSNSILAYTRMPNGVVDTLSSNDSASSTISTAAVPGQLTFSNIGTNTADVEVKSGTGNYDFEYGPVGFILGNGIAGAASSKNFTLSGLTPGTAYDVYIRSNCGGADVSAFVGPFTFYTAAAIPFFQDFENFGNLSSGIVGVEGWNSVETSAPNWQTGTSTSSAGTGPSVDHTVGSGGTFVFLETSGGSTGSSDTLRSPEILVDSSISSISLDFWYHMHGATTGSLEIYLEINGVLTPVNTIVGETHANQNDPWSLFTAHFPGVTGSVRIVFVGVRGSSFTGDLAIDDVKLDVSPSCIRPSNLAANVTSPTSATLSWQEQNVATQWRVQYGNKGFNLGAGIDSVTASNPFTLAGLTPNTPYEFYVKSICGRNDSSFWTGPFEFTTPCTEISTFPYTENFDGSLIGDVWSCWFVHNKDGGDTWNQDNRYLTARSAPYVAHGTGNNDDMLVSPRFDLPTKPMRLKLWDIVENATYNNQYSVLVSTTGRNVADFTDTLATFDVTNTVWTERTIDLSAYANQKIYIALWQFYSPSTIYGFGIDDFMVEEIPSCLMPSDLLLTDQQLTSVELSWTENNIATQWQIEYDTNGFTFGTGNRILVNSNPFRITGLANGPDFEVYVRSVCGRNDTSFWFGPFAFRTMTYEVRTDPPLTPNNGTSGITFNVGAHEDLKITEISSAFSSGNSSYTLWYSTDSINGAPTVSTSNNWIQYQTGTVTSPSTTAQIPIQLNTPIEMEAGNVYGFLLMPSRYHTRLATDPTVFSDSNLYINTGDNVGYGGAAPSPTIADRQFTGSVTYELMPKSNDDAGISSILTPADDICPGTLIPEIELRNYGINVLDSVQIVAVWNGVADTVYYKTSIQPKQRVNVSLKPFTITAGLAYDFRVYTQFPNGVADTVNSNDTLSMLGMRTGLIGNYTIDTTLPVSNSNYHRIADAAEDLNSYGVCGAVNFLISPGTYNEAILLEEIAGASATNSVTFNGGNADLVKIRANTPDLATFILNGSKYVTLENMTIEHTGTTNAAVLIGPNSHHNTVSKSVLRVAPSTTSSSMPLSFPGSITSTTATGTNASYNLIENNRMVNGYYGIRLYASSSNASIYNRFIGNEIDSVYYYGIQTYYTDSLEVENNRIEAVSRATTSAYGAYIYYSVNTKFNANYIHANNYGLYLYSLNLPVNSVKRRNYEVYNNMIIAEGSYGIYSYYMEGIDFFHNTVLTRGTLPAVQLYGSTSSPTVVDVRNNIFIAGSGQAIRTNMPPSPMFTALDNNIYYTSGSSLATIDGVNYSDLTAFQTALPALNISSIEGLPRFAGANDLHAIGSMPNNKGDNTVGVSEDIDGNPRPIGNDVIVDIGANEFELFGDDAGVIALASPAGVICPGNISLGFEVLNYGLNTLDSVELVSVINGVADTTRHYLNLAPQSSDTLYTNTYAFLVGTSYNIAAYTQMPNGIVDPDNSNDTLSLNDMQTGMAGTYTIDTSQAVSNTNFHSFNAAGTALDKFGVCAAVTFNVAPGVYNESVVFNEISGASDLNTVTFDGGNSTLVKLLDQGSSLATVILDGTDYMELRNMSIENTGTANAAVLFGPESHHNKIANSVVRVGISTTSSSIPIVFSGSITSTTATGTNSSYNTIENNRLINGYYGIRIYSSTSDPSTFNRIVGNTIDSAYYYGIYTYYTDSLELEGNTIDAYSRGSTSSYGAYVYNAVNSSIHANKIHSNGYGLYLYASIIPSASSIDRKYEIVNNMIISESSYGAYTYYADTVNIYHNTIVARGTLPALQSYGTAAKPSRVDLRNNILVAGSGQAFRTNMSPASMMLQFDHNIYYSTGSNLVTLDGVDYSDLAALQAGLPSYNISSIEGLPLFKSFNDLHIAGQMPNNRGDNSVGVTVDIDEDPRPLGNDTIVDIGADEFEIVPKDVQALALVKPVSSSSKCYGSTESLEVSFTNEGIDSLDFAVDSVTVTMNVSGAVNQTYTAVLKDNSLNSGMLFAPLDTLVVPVGTVDMTTVGTYYFSINISMDADSNLQNNSFLDSIVVLPPSAGLIRGIDTICAGDSTNLMVNNYVGELQWQISTGGAFTDIVGAIGSSIKVSPASITSYRAAACGTAFSDTLTVHPIILNRPFAIDSMLVITCGDTGTVTLVANSNSSTSGSKFEWFRSATGGLPITPGGRVISISPKGDTLYYRSAVTSSSSPAIDTFYVQEVFASGSSTQQLGPKDLSIGTYGAWSSTAQRMLFDVISKTEIKSVDVFFDAAINSGYTIEIVDESNSNQVLTRSGSVTVSSTTVPQTVPLNAVLQPGSYSMNFVTNPGTYRNNAGASYPYIIPGLISITGNSFNTAYYYMFYNWQIASGCTSVRDTAIASIDCVVGIDEEAGGAAASISIHPNPSRGVFNIVGSNVEEAVEISIFNSNGKLVYRSANRFLNNFEEQVDISNLSKGLYFVKLQSKSSTEMKKVVVQ